MNFFDLLKNFGTMLGQFPSMVAAVFGFYRLGLLVLLLLLLVLSLFVGL